MATILGAGLMIGALAVPAAAYDLWACPDDGAKMYKELNQGGTDPRTLCLLNPLGWSEPNWSDSNLGIDDPTVAVPFDVTGFNDKMKSGKTLDRGDGCVTWFYFYEDRGEGGADYHFGMADHGYGNDWVMEFNLPSWLQGEVTSVYIKEDC